MHIAKISLVSALLCALLMPAIASAKDAVKIAILPIVVHSADDPTFLRQGLADMIASRVDQLGVFDVTRVDDLETATTSLEKAVETGRSVDVDFVLFGSFTRFGTGASLDMQCVSTRMDFDGDPLREIFVHSENQRKNNIQWFEHFYSWWKTRKNNGLSIPIVGGKLGKP